MEALCGSLVVAITAALVGFVLYFGCKSDLKEMSLNLDVANLERRAAQEAAKKAVSDLKAMEDAARYASEREFAAKAAERLATAREAEAKAARDAVEARAKLPVDNPDNRALTQPLLMEAIRENGFNPTAVNDSISFMHGNVMIEVRANNLPMVSIGCAYSVDSAHWNLGYVNNVARKVTDSTMIGKVNYYDLGEDERVLVFSVSSIDLTYGSFRDSLNYYLQLISDNYGIFMDEYNQLAGNAHRGSIDDIARLMGAANKWEA